MRPFRTLGAGVLLAVALVLTSLTSTTSSASAAPVAAHTSARTRFYYGALALSPDGAYGKASNYHTRANAYRSAVKACERHTKYNCVRIGWVRNACAAMYYKTDARGFVVAKGYNKPHYGWAVSRSRAVHLARHGRHGGHVRSVCTSR